MYRLTVRLNLHRVLPTLLSFYQFVANRFKMAETIHLDALPYADGGYDDPAVRSAVLYIIDSRFKV